MATDKLSVIEEKLKQLAADKAAEIQKTENALADAINARTTAEAEAAAAFDEADAEAYQKALAEQRLRDDETAMLNKRLARIHTTPAISETKYNEICDKITACAAEELAKDEREAVKHIEAILSIYGGAMKRNEKARKLLHFLQHDIYNDDASMTNARGERVYRSDFEKANAIKDGDLPTLVNHISTPTYAGATLYQRIKQEDSTK